MSNVIMDLNELFSIDSGTKLLALQESMRHKLSDVELWNMIRKGDANAMIKLYERHYHILYSYGMKVCRDKDLTKDSIQEVFTYIWASRRTLNKVKKVRSYLFQSLWNKLVRELKKNSRQKDIFDHQVYQQEPVFSFENQWVKSEHTNEQLQRLSRSVDLLSKSQKEIIFLVFYEGLSYREIAEKKSINYQSVKNLCHKAIKKLRKMIVVLIPALIFNFM